MDDEDLAFIEALLEVQRSRSTYRIDEGRTLVNVHDPINCEGRGCAVHHPSDHKMKNWPKDFYEGGYFLRYCQHRMAHPDPDDVAYWRSRGRDISEHSCDGCCNSSEKGGY